MSRDRYDIVLTRSSLEEMWKPGMPMSQGYESAPNEWMGLSFFVLDRDGRAHPRPHGEPGRLSIVLLFQSGERVRRSSPRSTRRTTPRPRDAASAMNEAALALLKP